MPVFIIGPGRSGMTILGVTLAMHERVGFLKEHKAIWHYLFPDEDLIGSYLQGEPVAGWVRRVLPRD